MKNFKNSRKFKNSPNLLLLFVKITKFLEFSKKNNYKNYSFFELCPVLLRRQMLILPWGHLWNWRDRQNKPFLLGGISWKTGCVSVASILLLLRQTSTHIDRGDYLTKRDFKNLHINDFFFSGWLLLLLAIL